MAASHTLPHSHAIRKSGVLVLNGYGIRVQVNAGHLFLHDGIADERRTIRLPRVNHAYIRAGRHRPHPRHWQALAQLVGVSENA